MTSPNTIAARIAAAQARNRVTTVESSTPNDTYESEFDRYKAWVDDNGFVDPDDGKYITRNNVDLYFSEHVAVERDGTTGTIKRILQALQWYSKNKEHAGSEFHVESAIVKLALDTNKERQKNTATSKPGEDPHKGLKDVLPLADRLKIMHEIYSRGDWGPASVSFTWGNNAAVRGGSTRNLVFADWNLSRGFGPEESGPMSRTLFLIMRKGGTHKDRFDSDQQVGCLRHKEYKLCAVFAGAMWTLWNLSTQRQNPLDFLHRDKDERADWWDTSLIDWKKYGDASSAMRQIYKKTGVYNCKLTHDRTAAIQYAGAMGLAPHQINSFTNHLLEKIHRAYQAEADREVR